MGIIREELELALVHNKTETLKLILAKNNLNTFEKVFLKNNLNANNFIPIINYLIQKNQISNYFRPKELAKIILSNLDEEILFELNKEKLSALINIFKAYPNVMEECLKKIGFYNILNICSDDHLNLNSVFKITIRLKGWEYIITELKLNLSHSNLDKQIISEFIKLLVINFNTLTPEIFEMLQNFYVYGGIITEDFLKFCSKFNTKGSMFDVFAFYSGYKTIIKCADNKVYSDESLFVEIQTIIKHKNIRVVYDALKILNLPEEYNQIIKDAIKILEHTKKVNTAEKNKIFNYDFVKYVYPVLLQKSLDLLLYDSGASNSLIRLIKEGQEKEVLNYIEFYERINLFENNDKKIHYAFRSFFEYRDLIKNVIENEDKLTSEDIENLKKIIFNKNWWHVETFEELKSYDQLIVNSLKKELSMKVFGYTTIGELSKTISAYALDNTYKMKKIFKILQEHGEKDFFLTKEDFELIKFMNKVEENGWEYAREESVRRLENGLEVDLSLKIKKLIAKVREAYARYMNYSFSKISDFKDSKTYYYQGVKVIELNGKSFSFLVHTLHNFDQNFQEYQKKLEENPSLWDKLEGATTISLSSISEKNLNFLGKGFTNKINFLFNEFMPSDLLFMDGSDLMASHGGHKFEPSCNHCKFTDLDSLNYIPVAKGYTYNEIVLNRKGLKPCAILVLEEYKIDENIIRAAKYFNVPIIKLDRFLYSDLKDNKHEKSFINFVANFDKENIETIIYNGTDLQEDVYLLLEYLQEKRLTKEISYDEHISALLKIQNVLNLIDDNNLVMQKNMKVWKLNVILNNLYPTGKLSFVDDMRDMILNDGEKTYVVDVPADYEMDSKKTLISFNMIREKVGLKHDSWTMFIAKNIVAKPLAYTEYKTICEKDLKKDYILKDVIKEALLEKMFLEMNPFKKFAYFQKTLLIGDKYVGDNIVTEVRNVLKDYVKKYPEIIYETLENLKSISDEEWEAILKNLVAPNDMSDSIYQIKAKIDGWVTFVSNLSGEKLALTKK